METNIMTYPEFDHHEFIISLHDEKSKLNAVIAIHDRSRGMAHGGTRMKHYASDVEALKDALNLSRAMTYKSALANLPYGGAKGVIALPNEPYDKTLLLQAYAQKINALQGLFHTGTDVGLSNEDALLMARDCKYILGTKVNVEGYSTSKTAALGVYHSIKASARYKYGSDDLKGKRVGIKGVGKLGAELAKLLQEDGASLVIADVDNQSVQALLDLYPDITVTDPNEIITEDIDIYAPCAMGGEFTPDTIKRLNCDIIAGGANNQLMDDEVGDKLFEKGILYAPDYIANAGGLIFICEDLESDGFQLKRLLERVKDIETTLEIIFSKSKEQQIGTHRIADRMGCERIGR